MKQYTFEISTEKSIADLVVNSIKIIGDYIYAGTTEGVFISSDNGDTWAAANNGMPSILNIVSINEVNGYALAQTDVGMYLSVNNGVDWVAKNSGIPESGVNSVLINTNIIYIATISGVYFSANNGTGWSNIGSGLPSYYENIEVLVYIANKLYLRLKDDQSNYSTPISPISWELITEGVADIKYKKIILIRARPPWWDEDRYYALTKKDGIFYSSDGLSWSPYNTWLCNFNIFDLIIHDPSGVTGPRLICSSDKLLYFDDSTDSTANWIGQPNNSLPIAEFRCMYNTPLYLYVGTNGYGVYRYTFSSKTWHHFTNELTYTAITPFYEGCKIKRTRYFPKLYYRDAFDGTLTFKGADFTTVFNLKENIKLPFRVKYDGTTILDTWLNMYGNYDERTQIAELTCDPKDIYTKFLDGLGNDIDLKLAGNTLVPVADIVFHYDSIHSYTVTQNRSLKDIIKYCVRLIDSNILFDATSFEYLDTTLNQLMHGADLYLCAMPDGMINKTTTPYTAPSTFCGTSMLKPENLFSYLERYHLYYFIDATNTFKLIYYNTTKDAPTGANDLTTPFNWTDANKKLTYKKENIFRQVRRQQPDYYPDFVGTDILIPQLGGVGEKKVIENNGLYTDIEGQFVQNINNFSSSESNHWIFYRLSVCNGTNIQTAGILDKTPRLNQYCSLSWIDENVGKCEMPFDKAIINGVFTTVTTRKMRDTEVFKIPLANHNDIDPEMLIKTDLGNMELLELSLDLQSFQAEIKGMI